MKYKKSLLEILLVILQFVITIYLQRSPVYLLLFFLSIIASVYIIKILDSTHYVYKLCSMSLYLTIYTGIVVQIMAYIEDTFIGGILAAFAIPALIGFIVFISLVWLGGIMDVLGIKKIFIVTTICCITAMAVGFILYCVGISVKFLFVSMIWLGASYAMYIYVKKIKHIVLVIMMNTFIVGMTIGAYYSSKDIDYFLLSITVLVFIIMISLEYLAVIISRNIKMTISSSIYIVEIMLLFWSLRWLGGDIILSSSFIFACIFILSMNIAIKLHIGRHLDLYAISVIKLSSMVMFGGILLLVIAILTEGDFFEIPFEIVPDKKFRKINESSSKL